MNAPRLRMFAGPNGSGKSTIKDKIVSINSAWLGVYVNPDEIENEISQNGFVDLAKYKIETTEAEIISALYQAPQLIDNNLIFGLDSIDFSGSILRFNGTELNSYYVSALSDFLREKLTVAKRSFSFETVMSHPNKIELLKRASLAGFRNYLYYIATEDPEINLSRVRYRVKTGGHDVPPNKIRTRCFRSLENLLPAIARTDRAYIFDNSGAESVLLAEITDGSRMTIRKIQFYRGGLKNMFWNAFKNKCFVALAFVVLTAMPTPVFAQASPAAHSGKRLKRIIVRNAMVVDGSGKPAAGPLDITIENDVITKITGASMPKPGPASADELVIDATGKYVLPGLINLHGHTQDERAGVPMPVEYVTKMWLACGITTVRDAWASKKVLGYRDQINVGTLVGPRIFAYGGYFDAPTPTSRAQAIQRVLDLKAAGFDGIKLYTIDRDLMESMMFQAKTSNLRVMHHVGVEETNAWDDIKFGTTSIEHWYGIPDAAITNGRQNFPPNYNYNNEVDRFRYAGRLWREADPSKLDKVLQAMVDANVAWDPTLVIYEASRDLQRAQTNPAFAEYLHPVLEEYFKPNPDNHGSYFIGWSSTDETFWKENYRIWMKAVYDFEQKGGVIGTGEDAGFIYQIYGFGLLRELELHQEAGFHPLKVIQHATSNGAKILGKEDSLGRIRVGYKADLIVVNGNPLENFKVLSPLGVEEIFNGKAVKTGGIEWTIANGIPYHAPTLAAEIRTMVAAARKGQNRLR